MTKNMTPKEFWQNFQLGTEQELAGNFIYDALRNFHDMETLHSEMEIFPVLYGLSVGIERLLKVAVILLEFDDNTDIDSFEKSLITHNHLELFNRIKDKKGLTFSDVQIGLLVLLSTFYKTHRYDRFTLQSVTDLSKDKKAFLLFLHKNLQIDITEDVPFLPIKNSERIKKFIGGSTKKIAVELHNIIRDAAHTKGLYTYELSSGYSKAAKVFFGDEDSIIFEDEEIAAIEALVFLMKTRKSKLIDFIKEIKPLPLDPALCGDYLQGLLHRRQNEMQSIIAEIEAHYEDIEDKKERYERIKAIRDPSIFFD